MEYTVTKEQQFLYKKIGTDDRRTNSPQTDEVREAFVREAGLNSSVKLREAFRSE
jgi:hypothetical protein